MKKIVLFKKRLLCSEKDFCVMKIKFVLFWKRLLCSQKDIELSFASVGNRGFTP